MLGHEQLIPGTKFAGFIKDVARALFSGMAMHAILVSETDEKLRLHQRVGDVVQSAVSHADALLLELARPTVPDSEEIAAWDAGTSRVNAAAAAAQDTLNLSENGNG